MDQFSIATSLHINYCKRVMVPMHLDDQLAINCVFCFGCRRQGFPKATWVYLFQTASSIRAHSCHALHQQNR